MTVTASDWYPVELPEEATAARIIGVVRYVALVLTVVLVLGIALAVGENLLGLIFLAVVLAVVSPIWFLQMGRIIARQAARGGIRIGRDGVAFEHRNGPADGFAWNVIEQAVVASGPGGRDLLLCCEAGWAADWASWRERTARYQRSYPRLAHTDQNAVALIGLDLLGPRADELLTELGRYVPVRR